MMKRVLSKGMRHIVAPRSPCLKDLLIKELLFCPALWIAGKMTEVARRRWHFRYVPFPEVAMPAQEPSITLQADKAMPVDGPFISGSD